MSFLELLVVIGIVMILITLLFSGFKSMQRSNRKRLTEQMLSNCAGMLREYARATYMKGIKTDALVAPKSVEESMPDRTGAAVQKTREFTALMRGIPINDTAIKQLPAENLWPGNTPTEGPVVLDGWDNPIIFVPADGLSEVTVGGKVTTVRSPDKKPFFASAGADGSFAEGDDNVYSFSQ